LHVFEAVEASAAAADTDKSTTAIHGFARMKSLFSSLALVFSLCPLVVAAPFPFARGDYGAIIEADENDIGEEVAEASGLMNVALTDGGSGSVRLAWRNQLYAFKVRFIPDAPGDQFHGAAEKTVKKKGLEAEATPESLILKLKLSADVRTINVSLAEQPEGGAVGTPVNFVLSGAVADLRMPPGVRTAFIDPPTTTSAPLEGGSEPDPAIEGFGFATVAIGKSSKRNGRFVGRLPDHEVYSAGSPLRNTVYALRSSLYKARRVAPAGQVLGNAEAAPEAALHETRGITGTRAQLIARFRWYKKRKSPRTPIYNAYANGFDHRLELDAKEYGFAPGQDRRLVPIGLNTSGGRGLANANVRLRNGNLGNEIVIPVNISFLGVRILTPNTVGLKMSVNARLGRFSGSFKHPSHPLDAPRVKFFGAFQIPIGATPGGGNGSFLSVPDRNDATRSRSGKVLVGVGAPQ